MILYRACLRHLLHSIGSINYWLRGQPGNRAAQKILRCFILPADRQPVSINKVLNLKHAFLMMSTIQGRLHMRRRSECRHRSILGVLKIKCIQCHCFFLKVSLTLQCGHVGLDIKLNPFWRARQGETTNKKNDEHDEGKGWRHIDWLSRRFNAWIFYD